MKKHATLKFLQYVHIECSLFRCHNMENAPNDIFLVCMPFFDHIHFNRNDSLSLSHGMHQLNSTLVEVEDRSKNSESQQHRCIEMYALNVRSYNINSADMHVTKVKAFSLHLLRYARTTAKSPKIDGVCRRHYAFARMHVWQNDRYFISTIF